MSTIDRRPLHVVVNGGHALEAGGKSLLLAVVLAAVFGPLGMLYATVWGAIIMLIISGGFGLITMGVSLVITWPLGVLWAWLAAAAHNRNLRRSLRGSY